MPSAQEAKKTEIKEAAQRVRSGFQRQKARFRGRDEEEVGKPVFGL